MILTNNPLLKYDEWLDQAKIDGSVALIDKFTDWTSFDVIAKLRRLTGIKKIGHAGTLDPLATGLLIVCFGKATKTINHYQDMTKSYKGRIKIGAITKSFDRAYPEENQLTLDSISEQLLSETLKKFFGKISQIPPSFSAKKIDGVRQYKLARMGIEKELKAVEVEIYDLKLLDINLPFFDIEVACSKGTYIRALARDIGIELGTGGYLYELRRTAIGDHNVIDALTIDDFIRYSNGNL